MNCKQLISNAQAWLLLAAAFVVIATVVIGIAISLNSGFWTAPFSPMFVGLALAALSAAAITVSMQYKPADMKGCLGKSPCGSHFNAIVARKNQILGAIGVAITACLVAIPQSSIPWLGGAAILAALAAITVALGLITTALVNLNSFKKCLKL
ncbi:MAG: hypothetical protein KDD90_05945 [Sphingomonadaceae bacterium]|jgi:ABC-type transport system involved in cytochrome c biogenesis permease subunit|nr:hypothetical protein [Sphingomonadaceae bacterium]